MGLLNNHIVYLVGPIDKASDAGAGWRDNITPILEKMGIVVLNPCKKCVVNHVEGVRGETKADIDYVAKLKQEGNFEEVARIGKNIRNIDLRCTDKADFIIVKYDYDIHMGGTHEEIVTTNRAKKPILMMCPQGKTYIPTWYFGMLPLEFLFDNWTDLISYIKDIDSGIKYHKRWVFFNFGEKNG